MTESESQLPNPVLNSLSTRARYALLNAGIDSDAALSLLDREDLLAIKNLGEVSCNEILLARGEPRESLASKARDLLRAAEAFDRKCDPLDLSTELTGDAPYHAEALKVGRTLSRLARNAAAELVRKEQGRPWHYVTERLPEPGDRLLFWRRVAGGNTVYRESGWIDGAGWFVSEVNGRAYAPVNSAAESNLREVFAWLPEPAAPPLPGEGK